MRLVCCRRYRDAETHSGLSRYTSGDDDDFSASQGLDETIILGQITLDFGGGCDVGEIGSNAGCVDNIVKAQLIMKC